MGTLTFHPWPVRRDRPRPPRRAAHRPRPARPGTDFRDAVRVAGVARELLDELGLVGFPKTSRQPRRARLRPDRAAVGLRRRAPRRHRVRARAGARDGRASPPTGGRRSAASASSSTTTRTPATAPSPRPTACGPSPGAPVSARRWTGTSSPRSTTRPTSTCSRCPSGSPSAATRTPAIDDVANDLQPLLDLYDEQVAAGQGELNYPPDYPKMPGEPPRVQPSKKVAAHWDEHGNWVEKP